MLHTNKLYKKIIFVYERKITVINIQLFVKRWFFRMLHNKCNLHVGIFYLVIKCENIYQYGEYLELSSKRLSIMYPRKY